MPFSTRQSYLRAIADGTLEAIARGACGLCGQLLCLNGWSKRLFLDLLLRRSLCRRCCVSFTFLPCFVAPGKWYGYEDIDMALAFVTDPADESAPNAAFDEWERIRVARKEDGRLPGPSTRTVQRWVGELGASSRAIPWTSRVIAETVRRQPDHPIASQLPRGTTLHDQAVALLLALGALGALLIQHATELATLPALAAGLWCIEPAYRERCLALPSLAGRLIPGPSPRVSETGASPRDYPPRPSGSNPDP